ncbi:MAG: hypothetical protein FK733_03230 [Asgard group archaeon]|nr:hypothetical protein [Asgard group archaeon]
MKKALKIIIPLAIMGLLISTQFGSATFGVEVGNIFTYDVIKNNFSVTVGANSGTSTGYEVDDQPFAEGTQVDVEVTAVNPLDVEYELQAGSYYETEYSGSIGLGLNVIISLLVPFLAIMAVDQPWNQTAIEEKGSPLLIPFVENETTTWQTYIDMATDLQTSPPISTASLGVIGINATYSDTVSTFVFELYMSGSIQINDTLISNYYEVTSTLEHHYQFAYNKADGVMLGMRMEGSVSGTANGTAVSWEYSQHTEKVGYNLPGYTFGGGGGFIPGFEWFIAIPALAFIGIIAVVIRKRK